MKKFFLLAIATLAAVAAVSCKQEKVDALTMESSELTFSNAGGSQAIAFSSNVAWTASADQEWITLSNAQGESGKANITVTVAENKDYSTRTGVITVVAGSMKTTFKVTQAEPQVFGIASVYNVSAEAQQLSVGIKANKNYEVEIDKDCSSWVGLAPASKAAPVESTVTFNIAANTTLETRVGQVTIKTDEGDFAFEIVQSSNFSESSLADATYISNIQKIYDNDGNCPTTFGQYIVKLSGVNDKDVTVTLALNVAKADAVKDALPVGEFECDYAAAFSAGTFSLKDLAGANKYYTTIKDQEGNETLITDGTIVISKENKTYSIAASLVDDKGNDQRFSYVGEIAVADQSIGLQVGSIAYIGDYYTYFANDNSQWDLSFYVTEKIDAALPHIYHFSIDVFDGKGIVDPQDLPTGTFTINKEEEFIESPYATGTRLVDNMTFDGGQYGCADYDSETGSYKTAAVKDGTVTISKNDDGTYNYQFALVFNITSGYWDDDWNWIETEVKDVDWNYSFSNITNPAASDNQLRPESDKDTELSYVSVKDAYAGMWYGDKYSLGGNVFLMGWSSSVNDFYVVYLPLMSSSEWTFEKNYANRFCKKVVPDGTYTYVEKKPTVNGDYICNIKNASRKAYIKNSYTGSTVYVNKGTVTIADGKVTFDVEGPLTLADGTDGGKTVKYTGSLNNNVDYFQDYTTSASRLKQMDWNE